MKTQRTGVAKRAVCLVIRHSDGRYLGVTRRHTTNDWGLVGGKVEEGETDVQAMVREAFEEAGLMLDPEFLVVVFELVDGDFMAVAFEYQGALPSDFSREPRLNGEGSLVGLVGREALLTGTFAVYNRALFAHLDEACA